MSRSTCTSTRHKGESYRAEVYDDIAPRALAHVVATAELIAEVEGALNTRVDQLPDQFALARVRRERQQATRRLEVDRDADAWKATMERLDRVEAEGDERGVPDGSA